MDLNLDLSKSNIILPGGLDNSDPLLAFILGTEQGTFLVNQTRKKPKNCALKSVLMPASQQCKWQLQREKHCPKMNKRQAFQVQC